MNNRLVRINETEDRSAFVLAKMVRRGWHLSNQPKADKYPGLFTFASTRALHGPECRGMVYECMPWGLADAMLERGLLKALPDRVTDQGRRYYLPTEAGRHFLANHKPARTIRER